MASLILTLVLGFLAGCATNGQYSAPSFVSNVCNCYCGGQSSNNQTVRETGGCACNATLQASINQLTADLRDMTPAKKAKPGEDNFDLLFTTGYVNEYVLLHDLSHSLRAFTLSVWVLTTELPRDRLFTNIRHALVSYATTFKDNTLTLFDTDAMVLWIDQEERATKIRVNDGKWHHVVVTWENVGGAWQGFRDGVLISSGLGFKNGAVLRRDGVIVLGQDQDVMGGKFEYGQGMRGLISRVNLWDRVLTSAELSKLHNNPSPGFHGNILKWDGSWIAGIHGSVRVIRPSSCAHSIS